MTARGWLNAVHLITILPLFFAWLFGQSAHGTVSMFVKITKSPVYRILSLQLVMTLLVATSFLVVSEITAWSALLGGLVCVIPGIYILLMSSWRRPQTAAGTGLGIVLSGEAGKYGLSILLFVLVFTWVQPLDPLVFFGVFGGLQGVNLLLPKLKQVEK